MEYQMLSWAVAAGGECLSWPLGRYCPLFSYGDWYWEIVDKVRCAGDYSLLISLLT